MTEIVKNDLNSIIINKLSDIIANKIYDKIEDKLPQGVDKEIIINRIKLTLKQKLELNKTVQTILKRIENNTAVDLIAVQADILGAIPIPEVGEIVDIALQSVELALPQFIGSLISSKEIFDLYSGIKNTSIQQMTGQDETSKGGKRRGSRRRGSRRRVIKKTKTRGGKKTRRTRRKY